MRVTPTYSISAACIGLYILGGSSLEVVATSLSRRNSVGQGAKVPQGILTLFQGANIMVGCLNYNFIQRNFWQRIFQLTIVKLGVWSLKECTRGLLTCKDDCSPTTTIASYSHSFLLHKFFSFIATHLGVESSTSYIFEATIRYFCIQYSVKTSAQAAKPAGGSNFHYTSFW